MYGQIVTQKKEEIEIKLVQTGNTIAIVAVCNNEELHLATIAKSNYKEFEFTIAKDVKVIREKEEVADVN